jgi:hypothetical protein
MTNEQINIAIAEARGWTDTEIINEGGRLMYGQTEVPNYCNDFNAMHEQELWLFVRGWEWQVRYYDRLLQMSGCTNSGAHVLALTARQRAEAFLRTLGKWEEGGK